MPKFDTERLAKKRHELTARTAAACNISLPESETLLRIGRQQSLRVNTLKLSIAEAITELQQLGWTGDRFEWCPEGFSITSRLDAVKSSRLVTEGSVYIQNAASWLPVLALDPRPGDTVLDMCAAPGGKTSHIAACTNNQAKLTANDNSRPRIARTKANLQRLGVANVEYVLFDATKLSHKLTDVLFDKILLDAPCSGEGMMRLDVDKDFESWSVAHVKRLQQLQKKLIVQAWKLLKPGGTLVYSTCTMAPEENEAVVDYLLKHNDDAQIMPVLQAELLNNRVSSVRQWNGKQYDGRLQDAVRLYPSPEVEAFFLCKIQKLDTATYSV